MAFHLYEGVVAPAFTPRAAGLHYTDIATGYVYLSNGSSSSANWIQIGTTASITAHVALVSGVHGITAAAATVLDDATVSAMVDTLGGASSTGTGGLARATSPTFVTPTLGVASATSLDVASGTITTSDPALDASQTWNSGGVTFTGLKLNVTDAASASASLLMDLKVGGVTQFNVKKDGSFNASYLSYDGSTALMTLGTCGFNYPSGVLTSVKLALNDSNVGIPLVYITSDAANILAQRNGTAAQAMRVYGTYTDSGNLRRLSIDMTTAGVATIAALGLGTGIAGNELVFGVNALTPWKINSSGHILAGTDNTYGIGASGASRPKDIHLADSAYAGTSGFFRWLNRSKVQSVADGIITLQDNAGTSFDRLQFGGITSSFPALKRRTTALEVRLADDSAITTLVGAMVLKAGAVADGDFTNPVDGCHGYDTTNFKHYVRSGGTWRSSAAYA